VARWHLALQVRTDLPGSRQPPPARLSGAPAPDAEQILDATIAYVEAGLATK
jgi:hypothetical protein